MYLFACLTSFLLTLNPSSPLEASDNFTLQQNVQETNFSQNISYDDAFENATAPDEIFARDSDASTHVVASTEVDTDNFLSLPSQPSSTKEHGTTNPTSSLAPSDATGRPVTQHDDAITTETGLQETTPKDEDGQENRTTETQPDPTPKISQARMDDDVPPTEGVTVPRRVTTTSVPASTTPLRNGSSDAGLERTIGVGSVHYAMEGRGLTPTYSSAMTPALVENASSGQDNVTSFEETVEHNAILTTDFDAVTDKTQSIVVGHKCTRIFQESILWNVTDGGMLALKSCPTGYQGNMYRPCFSNGKWGNVDYSECRLEHLGRMRHMIFHQVQKGMLGNMYVLADEFSKYISSVDMKSPMDRLEAFEILNTFLKLDMSLKMDKSRDIKYIQSLLYSCNELIKKKTVLFSPGSQKNKLITEKAVEMIFDLTYFAEKALRGLLKTQKKQIAFRSTTNVVLYLYRGKLSRQFPLMNFSSDYDRDDELSSYFNLEKTLERSAYALIWVKGLHDLLSMDNLLVNSDVAVATILSPLNSLNHLLHPPTFDIGLRMRKEIPKGYTLKCGQLWNMSHLWNTEDCIKASRKGDIVTCRCHHLGSISLLLEEEPQSTSIGPSPPVGKLITVSCVTSLSATVLTLVINFLLGRRDQSLSIFILINLLVCLAAIQVTFMLGVNKTDRFEICLSFAVLLHYLFLVSCFWVVSYSIYLLQRLRSCMEYVGKIRDYCAFCWMLPTLLLIISFVGNPNGYETKQFCWLNVQRGILWSFVVPVTGLILVNTIVMILALKTFNEQMSVTHRVEICKTRNSMRAGITLLPFFAINWFFGILAVEDSENMILQVIFAFTNSLQGILTFIFFCVMDNNVQMLFRLKFHEVSRRPKVSAMRLKKSGSFPILERPLITLTDDNRRNDCTPLLSHRTTYSETSEDPCCSNIRV